MFEGWVATAAERFVAAGATDEQARALALGMIAALEGAFVLARALRSTEPLRVAGDQAAAAVAGALAGPPA